ncbi:hypothetical protein, partial [Cellulomonas septica]|uniref:hypothetical protein n=1 Tax=Cellulomonas septica TaxID=285080 RepID=UPI001B353623
MPAFAAGEEPRGGCHGALREVRSVPRWSSDQGLPGRQAVGSSGAGGVAGFCSGGGTAPPPGR